MSGENDLDVYEAHREVLKENQGKVVVLDDGADERLRLSPHRYPEDHEIVVEAALWPFDGNISDYKTFISKGLDSMDGGVSIVNNGAHHETREDAVQWLEREAQSFDGSPLNWTDRDRVHVTTAELEERTNANE